MPCSSATREISSTSLGAFFAARRNSISKSVPPARTRASGSLFGQHAARLGDGLGGDVFEGLHWSPRPSLQESPRQDILLDRAALAFAGQLVSEQHPFEGGGDFAETFAGGVVDGVDDGRGRDLVRRLADRLGTERAGGVGDSRR